MPFRNLMDAATRSTSGEGVGSRNSTFPDSVSRMSRPPGHDITKVFPSQRNSGTQSLIMFSLAGRASSVVEPSQRTKYALSFSFFLRNLLEVARKPFPSGRHVGHGNGIGS